MCWPTPRTAKSNSNSRVCRLPPAITPTWSTEENCTWPRSCIRAVATPRRCLATLLRLAGEKLELRTGDRPDEIHQVRLSDPELFQYHLVFMHGRAAFRLTPAERKELRLYLERGGMLFADAICSSPQFAEAFRKEMKLVLPEQTLTRIPVNHPLFRPGFGGEDITTVSRRQPERRATVSR